MKDILYISCPVCRENLKLVETETEYHIKEYHLYCSYGPCLSIEAGNGATASSITAAFDILEERIRREKVNPDNENPDNEDC